MFENFDKKFRNVQMFVLKLIFQRFIPYLLLEVHDLKFDLKIRVNPNKRKSSLLIAFIDLTENLHAYSMI